MELIRDIGRPPVVMAPSGLCLAEACEWLSASEADLRRVLDAEGAVLVRGMPVTSEADFGRIRDVVILERADYHEQATPRTSFGDDVYSSTDFPADQRIMLHNENSYTLTFPGLLLFGCLESAGEGGATPVADCRKVLQAIPSDVVSRFREVGWALVRNYTDYFGLGWRKSFGTYEPDEVMRYCAENKIGASWESGARLCTVQRRSALIRHPRLGEDLWFNHVAFWSVWSLDEELREALLDSLPADELPYNTFFGDGEPLREQEVGTLVAAYEAATVREAWQSGDVMLVDNLLAAHGRDPFRGGRRILVAMGETIDLQACAPTVAPLPGFGR
jgi:alpha-ketoglutarate-dependent taurine dioxygenase